MRSLWTEGRIWNHSLSKTNWCILRICWQVLFTACWRTACWRTLIVIPETHAISYYQTLMKLDNYSWRSCESKKMFVGFWEIVLISAAVLILVFPEFSKSKKIRKTHRLKLYAIIAILLLFIMILSRSLFFLFASMIGMVALLGVMLFAFYRYTKG